MSELRVVFTETSVNPWTNLAWEGAFLHSRCSDRTVDALRIRQNKNAVEIGVFQRASEEVNLKYPEQKEAGIVKRFAEGVAVYQDPGSLNSALSVKPINEKGNADYLCIDILKGVDRALEELGLNPSVQNVNDVIIGDRKVVGVAASLRGEQNCGFIHGAVLYSVDLDVLASLSKTPLKKPPDKGILSVKYRVTNISALKPRVRVEDIARALIKSFMETLNMKAWYSDLPRPREIEVAEKPSPPSIVRPSGILREKGNSTREGQVI
ncbi:MAG: lipoate--protein ligase family protein [Thermosphaera aggregans]|uniref:lipoate--protein ligase family protein n=1 Tax=Thermosphaera aggregans TaxID=54254 RepID=UPI003BFAD99A